MANMTHKELASPVIHGNALNWAVCNPGYPVYECRTHGVVVYWSEDGPCSLSESHEGLQRLAVMLPYRQLAQRKVAALGGTGIIQCGA